MDGVRLDYGGGAIGGEGKCDKERRTTRDNALSERERASGT